MSVNSDVYDTSRFEFYYKDDKNNAKSKRFDWSGSAKLDYAKPEVKSSVCYMIVNMKTSSFLINKLRSYT